MSVDEDPTLVCALPMVLLWKERGDSIRQRVAPIFFVATLKRHPEDVKKLARSKKDPGNPTLVSIRQDPQFHELNESIIKFGGHGASFPFGDPSSPSFEMPWAVALETSKLITALDFEVERDYHERLVPLLERLLIETGKLMPFRGDASSGAGSPAREPLTEDDAIFAVIVMEGKRVLYERNVMAYDCCNAMATLCRSLTAGVDKSTFRSLRTERGSLHYVVRDGLVYAVLTTFHYPLERVHRLLHALVRDTVPTVMSMSETMHGRAEAAELHEVLSGQYQRIEHLIVGHIRHVGGVTPAPRHAGLSSSVYFLSANPAPTDQADDDARVLTFHQRKALDADASEAARVMALSPEELIAELRGQPPEATKAAGRCDEDRPVIADAELPVPAAVADYCVVM